MSEVHAKQILPEWMCEKPIEPLPKPKTRLRLNFLEKTLHTIRKRLQQEQFIPRQKNTFIRRLSPPITVLSFFAILFSIAITHSLHFLFLMQILLIIGALFSRLRLSSYFFRCWLPVLIFSILALTPALFNIITPGTPLLYIYHASNNVHSFLPNELYISYEGVKGFSYVMLRSMDSVGLAILLLANMPFYSFSRALSKLGVPSFIVMMLDLTYRYMYLFLPLFEDYILGRQSRMVGDASYMHSMSWIGATIADLLRVTNNFGTQLYEALCSRGYTGEYQSPMPWNIGAAEIISLGLSILTLGLAYYAPTILGF